MCIEDTAFLLYWFQKGGEKKITNSTYEFGSSGAGLVCLEVSSEGSLNGIFHCKQKYEFL